MHIMEEEPVRRRRVGSADSRSHPSGGDASFVQKSDPRAVSDESDADVLFDSER